MNKKNSMEDLTANTFSPFLWWYLVQLKTTGNQCVLRSIKIEQQIKPRLWFSQYIHPVSGMPFRVLYLNNPFLFTNFIFAFWREDSGYLFVGSCSLISEGRFWVGNQVDRSLYHSSSQIILVLSLLKIAANCYTVTSYCCHWWLTRFFMGERSSLEKSASRQKAEPTSVSPFEWQLTDSFSIEWMYCSRWDTWSDREKC